MLAPAVLLAIWASAWVTVNTANDIHNNDPDGGAYIGMADEIRGGHGPTAPSTYKFDPFSPQEALAFEGHVPSTHFPPGYPAALAATSVVTGETLSAARVVNAGCVFLNVVLLGLLAARLTGYRSVVAATAPVVLVLFVPDRMLFDGPGWLQVHLGVYSEPLFMVAITGALLAITSALSTAGRSRAAFVFAGALAAVALLTRYSGIAIVVTLVVAVALLGAHRRFTRRLRPALFLGGAATLPMLLFLGWSASRGGGGARTLAYHPERGELEVLERIGRFFFPIGWSSTLQAIGVVVIAAVAVAAACWLPPRARQHWHDDVHGQALLRVALLFTAFYLAVLVFTVTFLDATTRYGARFLAPVRGIVGAVAVAAVYRLVAPYLRAAVVTVLAALAVAGLVYTGWGLERFWLDRASRPPRHRTPTEQVLAEVPRDALIVTDAPYVAYLSAGRRSFVLPQRIVHVTQEPNPEFDQQLSAWGSILSERGGYAFFTTAWGVTTTPADLSREVDLQLVSRSGDESLYRIEPTAS